MTGITNWSGSFWCCSETGSCAQHRGSDHPFIKRVTQREIHLLSLSHSEVLKVKNAEHLARASGQGRIVIKNGCMGSPVWPHYKWSAPSACIVTALVLITTQMQGKVGICHGISPGLLVCGAMPFRCFHPLMGLRKCLCLASTQILSFLSLTEIPKELSSFPSCQCFQVTCRAARD